MHFIVKVSCQGHIEFPPAINNENVDYTLCNIGQCGGGQLLTVDGKLLLSADADKLSVDIFCNHQIFLSKDVRGGFLASSSLELIFAHNRKKFSPNLNYFLTYISCGPVPTTSTPFIGVLYLPPGSSINLSDLSIDLGAELNSENSDFLDVIEKNLSAGLASSRDIVLEYSGGLESSILLHALLRTHPGRLRLIHLTDSGSGDIDDIQRVRSLAQKYRCDLTVFDFEDVPPFQITTCSKIRPNFPHPGLVNIGYIDYSSDMLMSPDTIILNGSGGDSIFCAYPQKGLPVELLRGGNILGAIREVRHLADYFRMPLIPTVMSSVKEFKEAAIKVQNPGAHIARAIGSEKILTNEYMHGELKIELPEILHTKLSTRERHLYAAINRFEMRSSPVAGFPDRYFYPFLSANAISAGLSTPSTQLLKGGVSRNPRFFRQPNSNPATSASRSITLPSLWKV